MNDCPAVKSLHWPWPRILVSAWFSLVFLAALPAALPTSWWFSVNRIFVADAMAQIPPKMQVDRTIRRPFLASWTVTVKRRTERGGWSWHCNATGLADYLPDAELPDPLTLEWWASAHCARLLPGVYLIDSHWRIHLPGWGGMRDLRIRSNKFTVME